MSEWKDKYPSSWARKLSFTTKPKHKAAILKAMKKKVEEEMLREMTVNPKSNHVDKLTAAFAEVENEN